MESGSKAPLRIGLAGGGTDVSPYCDIYGGDVVNAAITLYAHCRIQDLEEDIIRLKHADIPARKYELNKEPEFTGELYDLHLAVINRVKQQFGPFGQGISVQTEVDVPIGSGLGTSSTMVVAILGAVLKHRDIELSKHEIASMAFQIERLDLEHPGGRQDQYAAVFGGINRILFHISGVVEVKPLSPARSFIEQLRSSILLYYTAHNRHSAGIIEEQMKHAGAGNNLALNAMHELKKQSTELEKSLIDENLFALANSLDLGYFYKKQMASGISTTELEKIYEEAKKHGALGGKISGAGGGGFMTFICTPGSVESVKQALIKFGGQFYEFEFNFRGLTVWRK